MLDLSHIPNSQQDIQIFNANGSAWQTWRKPKKCNYVYIMCIGGAGGGAGGSTSILQAGSGGGSGAVVRALYNAQQLSDILYIQVGLGGAGGLVAANGSAGTRSWVGLQPAIVAQNMVIGSGTTGGAAAGGIANTGTSANGESAATQATATFLTLSNFIGIAGQASPTIGTANVTPLTSQITCAGASGNVNATAISPLISAGVNGSGLTNGTNGENGITSWKPFYSLGGAGAGNSQLGSGGKGGDGGIGSGGGAGGSASSAGLAGNGGKGGDGIVIIISF